MDLERYRDAWARKASRNRHSTTRKNWSCRSEGTVKSDQGIVQYDQVQLSYCHITAPIDGRVGLRLVDPGNVVQSSGGLTLVVITQIQPITIIFTIAEDNLGQVQPRLRRMPSYGRRVRSREHKEDTTGKLMTLDNQIDTTTGTVKARASFANKDGMLFPNQFVNTPAGRTPSMEPH